MQKSFPVNNMKILKWNRNAILLLVTIGPLVGAALLLSPPLSAGTAQRVAAQAEKPLFAYTRDDTVPEQTTTVSIDASRHAAAPIRRDIFGNFIEHLGDVVYPGLWAQALLNPNLERIAPGDTEPLSWDLEGATWQQGGFQSPYCVRMEGTAALRQDLDLPVHRTRNCVLTFAARHVGAAAGADRLELAIQGVGAKQTEIYLLTEEKIADAAWKMHRVVLTLPAGRIARGERLRLLIRHKGNGAVEIDQVEIFPADSVQGMDPDVLQKAREWHMPLVRWPGGNFASGYHWQDGVGNRMQRPTLRSAAWGDLEPNHFGTDEFLTFCRILHVEPQLTVNAGDGAPTEAANWVRYCNAPLTDAWGGRRAANGHAAPYNVRLWEVGNELYGPWQVGHTDAAHNAARYVRFRDALLKAAPHLRLIATGKGDEFSSDGMQRNTDWNRRLLQAAVAGHRPAPDYLSVHPLVPLPGSLKGLSYADQYNSAMAHPTFLDREYLPDLGRLIAAVPGAQGKTRVAVTEWGIIVGGEAWREGPNHDSQAGAIYNALALNAMLRHSDLVTLANMTAFMHGGGIKKPAGVVIVDPQYYTQQLYAVSGMKTAVATAAIGPGQNVPARGFLPAVADVPDVDVFAALAADAHTLVVFAVNRHLTDSRPLKMHITGFQAASLKAVLLTAASPQTRNTLGNPDAVAPHPFSVPPLPADAHADWRTTLPAHSLVVFTLRCRP